MRGIDVTGEGMSITMKLKLFSLILMGKVNIPVIIVMSSKSWKVTNYELKVTSDSWNIVSVNREAAELFNNPLSPKYLNRREGLGHFEKSSDHIDFLSEAHDIDLRSVSHVSLPAPLFSDPNNTTLLRNVKSLSDLSQTYRLDSSLANIRDENSYMTQLGCQDQVTAKQRNRCVFEWLEGIEKKTFFLPTI
ncbi:unnamed protein product [Onchocerca flexuosa]|uniref:PAS domain-containing protein n=1 Tax=Onchocerca flexuosa TaxID=387005 RepID=A0A183I0N2_9BILA|nr:unnamed protein product [Onchocerca flexuosa]